MKKLGKLLLLTGLVICNLGIGKAFPQIPDPTSVRAHVLAVDRNFNPREINLTI